MLQVASGAGAMGASVQQLPALCPGRPVGCAAGIQVVQIASRSSWRPYPTPGPASRSLQWSGAASWLG